MRTRISQFITHSNQFTLQFCKAYNGPKHIVCLGHGLQFIADGSYANRADVITAALQRVCSVCHTFHLSRLNGLI